MTAPCKPCWSAPAHRIGDLIFFGADKQKVVNDAMGALRLKIGHSEFGKQNGLFTPGWRPLWVVDFPMFEYDEASARYTAVHHPFTAPKEGHEDWMVTAPEKCISQGYDMVLNGWEMGGGSVRIHRADVQQKVFDALQITPEEAQLKFGFLLDALQYGAPAARRTGLWPGPHRHPDDRGRIHPRRNSLPQNPARPMPADPGPQPGGRKAIARTAHPFAEG